MTGPSDDTPAYSAVGDLLTGNLPLSTFLSPAKFVQDATNEIDSKIGLIYKTPLDLDDTVTIDAQVVPNPIPRPARLMIKRIANFLASGRLILAMDISGEDNHLHSYGESLVTEALAALGGIQCGDVPIPGAGPADPDAPEPQTGPRIINSDSVSAVDVFYRNVMPQYPIIPVPIYGKLWAPNQ